MGITTDYRNIDFNPFPQKSFGASFSPASVVGRVHSKTKEVWDDAKKPVKAVEKGAKVFKTGIPKAMNPTLLSRLAKSLAVMGLLSLINIFVTVGSQPDNLKRMLLSIDLGDAEGAVKASLERIIDGASIVKEITVFTGSLAALEAIPVITAFSIIALPLGIALLSAGIAMGTYNTIRQGIHFHQIRQLKSGKSLEKYLTEKLGASEGEFVDFYRKKYSKEFFKKLTKIRNLLDSGVKNVTAEIAELKNLDNLSDREKKLVKRLPESVKTEKQRAALLAELQKDLIRKKELVLGRQTDKNVVNYMKKLKGQLGIYSADFMNDKVAQDGIADLKTLMRRKITLEVVGVAAKTAMLVTLIAGVVFPILAPIVVAGVGAGDALLALTTHVYKKKFLDRGLIHAEYLNPPKPREVKWANFDDGSFPAYLRTC